MYIQNRYSKKDWIGIHPKRDSIIISSKRIEIENPHSLDESIVLLIRDEIKKHVVYVYDKKEIDYEYGIEYPFNYQLKPYAFDHEYRHIVISIDLGVSIFPNRIMVKIENGKHEIEIFNYYLKKFHAFSQNMHSTKFLHDYVSPIGNDKPKSLKFERLYHCLTHYINSLAKVLKTMLKFL